MLCSPKDIVGLRQAARRCRALAAAAEDGFASLSYAQLADEIEAMIAARQAAPGTEFVAPTVNMSNHFGLAA